MPRLIPTTFASSRRQLSFAVIAAAVAGFAPLSHAASIEWLGSTSNDWSTGANWQGGTTPGSSNDALFNLTSYSNQPTLNNNDTAAGIIFDDGSTSAASVNIAGTATLTVGNDGILMNANAQANTISAPLILSSPSITNNSTNPLTFTGSITANSGITVAGSGVTHFNISGSPISGTFNVLSGTAEFDDSLFTGNPFASSQTFTVYSAGTLVVGAPHALGNYTGPNPIILLGGTLTLNAEQYISTLEMNGATVNGTSELRTDAYATATITVDASNTTSTYSANLVSEYGQYFDFNVAQGATSSGVDLLISGAINSSNGNGGIIKDGAGTLSLTSGSSQFTGNVTVNAGTLITSGRDYYGYGGLGSDAVSGRVVTVNAGASLVLDTNNVFGGGGNILPTLNISGGTLTTNQYNSIGTVNLAGGTLLDSTQDSGYDGFQFIGDVNVAGSSPSYISSNITYDGSGNQLTGFGDHLNTNTVFNVAPTGSSGPDLVVSSILYDLSADFGGAGGFTKEGAGTMILTSNYNHNAYNFTGNVTVNNGTVIATEASGFNGSLGDTDSSGRVITINTGATVLIEDNPADTAAAQGVFTAPWTFQNNPAYGYYPVGAADMFGYGIVGYGFNGKYTMPLLVINGGTLSATRYTPLGDITLNSGAVLTQASLDTAHYLSVGKGNGYFYEGYQFVGDVTVGGTSPSFITATANNYHNGGTDANGVGGTIGGDHLGPNTTFDVAVTTGTPGTVDLVVSAPLINQSDDFNYSTYDDGSDDLTDYQGQIATGGLTKAGAGIMSLSASNTYTGDTTITAGTLLLTETGSLASGNINIGSGAVFQLGATTTGHALVRNLTSVINVNAGGLLSVAAPTTHTARQLVVLTGALNIAGSSNAWTGTVDISANDLDVKNGNLATITNQVKSGFNSGAGYWNGTGITSSAAAADSTYLTAVGVIANNASGHAIYGSGTTLGNFDGYSPAATDVLVKYTWYGDANLDGVVDGSDYTLIDNGFNNHLTGWYNGDFNYDGVIDGSDYTLIDNAFNTQGSSLGTVSAEIATATAQPAAGGAAVPEPASLTLMGLAGIALLRRRRNR